MIEVILSLFVASLPVPPAQRGVEPPPGMILVRGGSTTIGSKEQDIEALGQENELNFPSLVRETPQHTVRLDDFFLMVNEVSNEQYAAFVRASGARPPWTWGDKAADEARHAFLEQQAQVIKEALAAGEAPPARQKFDLASWWAKNWEGKEWEVPAGQEARPVTYVDYQDARAYARWAGLRLMTEFEFQRAGRGNGDSNYPWGDDPIDKEHAATQDARISDPLPAGALPKGATSSGMHHLLGNVWEWTSSPFTPYPKYKDLSIEVGTGSRKRTVPGMTRWDANQRVVVGGSFQNGNLAARLTTRRGADRDEATNSLGFRCAASIAPGRDIADVVLSDDVPPNMRPEDLDYDGSKTVATDRWISEPGVGAVENYAVIQAYDYALFIPAIDVDVTSIKSLREASIDAAPVPLGVFSTTVALLEPELAPGTYLVAFRASSKPPKEQPAGGTQGKVEQDPEAEAAPVVRVPPGYDWEQESFLFYRPDGEPVTALPAAAADMQYVRPQEPQIAVVDTTRQVDTGEVDEKGQPILVDEPIQVAGFKVNTWVKVNNKALAYDLRLVAAPGTFDGWRR